MSDTPRTDALKTKWSMPEGSCNSTCSPEAREVYELADALEAALSESEAARKRLDDEIETLRSQLAGCGVAAMQNTPDSIKERIGPDNPYYSASYGDVCRAVDREIAERQRADELRGVLLMNGFVPCDIPACNCGSWHARFGLKERWEEIKETVAEAGHPLCNENGHILLDAVKALIAERDAERQRAEKAEAELNDLRAGYNNLKLLATDITDRAIAAKAELAECREDAERLEWMQFNGARVFWSEDDELCQVIWADRDERYKTELFDDWREAIDAARKP